MWLSPSKTENPNRVVIELLLVPGRRLRRRRPYFVSCDNQMCDLTLASSASEEDMGLLFGRVSVRLRGNVAFCGGSHAVPNVAGIGEDVRGGIGGPGSDARATRRSRGVRRLVREASHARSGCGGRSPRASTGCSGATTPTSARWGSECPRTAGAARAGCSNWHWWPRKPADAWPPFPSPRPRPRPALLGRLREKELLEPVLRGSLIVSLGYAARPGIGAHAGRRGDRRRSAGPRWRLRWST